MHGGAAATGVGAVDDIVVDQRSGVEELERARRVEHGLQLCVDIAREIEGAYRAVAERRELGAEALSASQESERLVEQRPGVVSERLERLPVSGDRISDALLYEPCESGCFMHATSLAAVAKR
ncbi:hypothetical protein GCM10027033_15900 [Leucobacter ruminantium]